MDLRTQYKIIKAVHDSFNSVKSVLDDTKSNQNVTLGKMIMKNYPIFTSIVNVKLIKSDNQYDTYGISFLYAKVIWFAIGTLS